MYLLVCTVPLLLRVESAAAPLGAPAAATAAATTAVSFNLARGKHLTFMQSKLVLLPLLFTADFLYT
jgi:hypothetical protein